MHSRRAPVLSMLLFTVLGAASVSPSRADALDGVLEVRSAYVSGDQGVLQLFARDFLFLLIFLIDELHLFYNIACAEKQNAFAR